MNEKSTIEKRETEILNNILEVLKTYLSPAKIILFGSRAEGKFYKHSDFDIAVEVNEKIDARKRRKIRNEIEKISGLYKVDIVYLSSVEEDFKNIILETGKIIYAKES